MGQQSHQRIALDWPVLSSGRTAQFCPAPSSNRIAPARYCVDWARGIASDDNAGQDRDGAAVSHRRIARDGSVLFCQRIALVRPDLSSGRIAWFRPALSSSRIARARSIVGRARDIPLEDSLGRERAVLPEDSVGAAKRIHPSWASMVLVRRRFRWRRSLAEPSLLATVSLPKKETVRGRGRFRQIL